MDDDELYCRDRLGLKNVRGSLARRLKALSIPATTSELLDRPLSQARYLVVDLETTGQGPGADRIIELGAVEVNGFELGRELCSLVRPRSAVPGFISELTGIRPEMLVGAPALAEVLPLVRSLLRARVLVAHNLKFDSAFLESAWEQVFGSPLEAPGLCTVRLARRRLPDLPGHDLDAVAAALHLRPGSGLRARHRALGDALLAARILVRFCRGLEREGIANVAELLAYQKRRRKRSGQTAPRSSPGK